VEEDTDILDPEVDEDEDDDQAPPPVEGDTVSREQYEKVVKAERSLRTRLRRTEMESEYGKDVVELVPATLPLKEQRALAAKLKERFGSQAAQTQPDESADASPEVATEQPTEQERRAAALVQPGSGGSVPGGVITDPKEAAAIAMSNPARYEQMRAAGTIKLDKIEGLSFRPE
jgi:hypothetical protein